MSTPDEGRTQEIAPGDAWPGEPTAAAVTAVQPAVAPPVRPVPLDDRPPLPPRAPLWPWALAAALLLLVAALLVWLLVFHGRGSTSSPRRAPTPAPAAARTQRVPNLVGQPLPAAQRRARQLRLLPVVVRRSSDQPAGRVLAELPAPGTLVKAGAPITLTISAGSPAAVVPDVVGLPVLAATQKLRAGGFEPRVVTVPSPKPAGTVLRRQPAKARRGAVVTLSVAKGPVPKSAPTRVVTVTTVSTAPAAPPPPPSARPVVPRLVGQELGSALSALERAGLLAKVVYLTSQQPLGQVIGQNPAAGTPAARQRRIQVNAAEGANPGNPAQVPDLTGEDAATARSDLESAGFQAVVVRTKRAGASGSVLEQQPAAGTTLSTGDIVAIYVP